MFGKPIEPVKFEESTISITMASEISCWRMTLSDMFCFSSSIYPLGFCGTRRNNEIILRKIKAPESERTQEHAELMFAIQKRYVLNKACMNFSPFEDFWSFREKYRGIDVRLRIHLHQFGKYPLRPTPVGNPVCYKRYFFCILIHLIQRVPILEKANNKRN